MIETPAVLVVSNDQQCSRPVVITLSDGIVDIRDQDLSIDDVLGRMIGIRREVVDTAIARLDERVFWQRLIRDVFEERWSL